MTLDSVEPGRMPLMSEWVAWHDGYAPGSPLTRRLAVVQRMILEALDACPPGPITIMSMCAGDGRDVLGVLSGHLRRDDVRGRLGGFVPADIVLVCGIFGNISEDDIHNTVARLPALCGPNATVIWTRGTFVPD